MCDSFFGNVVCSLPEGHEGSHTDDQGRKAWVTEAQNVEWPVVCEVKWTPSRRPASPFQVLVEDLEEIRVEELVKSYFPGAEVVV